MDRSLLLAHVVADAGVVERAAQIQPGLHDRFERHDLGDARRLHVHDAVPVEAVTLPLAPEGLALPAHADGLGVDMAREHDRGTRPAGLVATDRVEAIRQDLLQLRVRNPQRLHGAV